MFEPVEIPADAVMLYNVVKPKPGVTREDLELALGEMCYIVKENYPEFIAGQVWQFAGFISDEGSVDSTQQTEDHIAIITYWQDFDSHERSHKDQAFNQAFGELLEMCDDAYEIGYQLLWQGN